MGTCGSGKDNMGRGAISCLSFRMSYNLLGSHVLCARCVGGGGVVMVIVRMLDFEMLYVQLSCMCVYAYVQTDMCVYRVTNQSPQRLVNFFLFFYPCFPLFLA